MRFISACLKTFDGTIAQSMTVTSPVDGLLIAPACKKAALLNTHTTYVQFYSLYSSVCKNEAWFCKVSKVGESVAPPPRWRWPSLPSAAASWRELGRLNPVRCRGSMPLRQPPLRTSSRRSPDPSRRAISGLIDPCAPAQCRGSS